MPKTQTHTHTEGEIRRERGSKRERERVLTLLWVRFFFMLSLSERERECEASVTQCCSLCQCVHACLCCLECFSVQSVCYGNMEIYHLILRNLHTGSTAHTKKYISSPPPPSPRHCTLTGLETSLNCNNEHMGQPRRLQSPPRLLSFEPQWQPCSLYVFM